MKINPPFNLFYRRCGYQPIIKRNSLFSYNLIILMAFAGQNNYISLLSGLDRLLYCLFTIGNYLVITVGCFDSCFNLFQYQQWVFGAGIIHNQTKRSIVQYRIPCMWREYSSRRHRYEHNRPLRQNLRFPPPAPFFQGQPVRPQFPWQLMPDQSPDHAHMIRRQEYCKR